MKQNISYEQYNTLPWSIKNKIRIIFQIEPTHPKKIVNNAMKTDGIAPDDLKVVNIGMMIEVLEDSWAEGIKDWGIENLCDQLWEAVLNKIKDDNSIKESPWNKDGTSKKQVKGKKDEKTTELDS